MENLVKCVCDLCNGEKTIINPQWDERNMHLATIECPSCDGTGTTMEELWDADPNCLHEIICADGGGVKCKHCRGWFCY